MKRFIAVLSVFTLLIALQSCTAQKPCPGVAQIESSTTNNC